jgi:predicted dehydrogenase
VGHIRRFFPSIIQARQFQETGLLGKILKIDVFEGTRFDWESRSGYHFTSPFGGVITDTGSHSLDTLLYVIGLDEKRAEFRLVDRTRIPEIEPSHVFKASFKISGETLNAEASIYLSRRTFLANKMNIYCENGILEVPLDMKNAVRISNHSGKTILHEQYPLQDIDAVFHRQFQHILSEGGELLKVSRFLNTTKLLETLL